MNEFRDDQARVKGHVASDFLPCAEAFRQNFRENGELGAACAIFLHGEPVLDMWGGIARPSSGKSWTRNSIVPVFSVTKGVGAISILHLVEAGLLELDRPIADYWPEFSAHGKGRVTVREGLAHRAGIPVVDGPVSIADIQDTRGFASRIANQPPVFEPGTSHIYHAITIGWLTSELVWRVTGRSIGNHFRDALGKKLGLNLWIGIPQRAQEHVAEVKPGDFDPDTELLLKHGTVLWRALTLNGLFPRELAGDGTGLNDPRIQGTELAGVSGISDARSLAALYAAVIGDVGNVGRLVSRELLADACTPVSLCPEGKVEASWGAGFVLPFEGQPMLGPTSFGHDGAGKSIAFADRDHGIAFAYVRNRMNLQTARDGLVYAVIGALRSILD